MTRIIGGSAGGRRIATPPGDSTRPTSDRTREALFSSLEATLGSWSGVRVLDLYAGSGAVALEALSRGAEQAVCVERDRRTAALIRRNAATLGLALRVEARSVSSHLQGEPSPYDVAFLDPPYDLPGETVTADLEALTRGWLAPGALVVVERSARALVTTWPDALQRGRERRYGETALTYARFGSVPD